VDTPVSLADIAPTITDFSGAAPLPRADGRSLRPALEGAPLPARPVYAMAMERQSRFAPLQRGRYAVIDGTLKLVLDRATGAQQLFDLATDAGEQRDLAAQRPQDSQRLRQLLETQLGEAEAARQRLFPR
jgi:arylsulfatase A-like enzyme